MRRAQSNRARCWCVLPVRLRRLPSVAGTAPEGATGNTEGRYLAPSPEPGSSVVTAWADGYIQFDNEPEWQKRLRKSITARCASLDPSPGEVVHATFFGDKPPRVDVENLVLYNMHYSFTLPGRNGIRFEHGRDTPAAPDGEAYRVGYRYALAPRDGGFTDWEQGRTVASFDWTDLGKLRREKVQAQVWLALARRRSGQPEPRLVAGTPFAVKMKIRPPHANSPGPNADLVKGLVDGVVSAHQAHTDRSTSGEAAARLAQFLPADPDEIETLLLDDRWAVLGAVPRLVYLRGAAVQWNPADDWCAAGELLTAAPEPTGTGWAISGQIVELSRRPRRSTMNPEV